MVVRVADRARESGARGVYVATDHRDIAAAVERCGHQAVMTRGDHATGTDRIAEVVERLGLGADDRTGPHTCSSDSACGYAGSGDGDSLPFDPGLG